MVLASLNHSLAANALRLGMTFFRDSCFADDASRHHQVQQALRRGEGDGKGIRG